MSTPYKPVSWGNEYISSDKLNIMTSNDQWLYERTPTVYYNAYGIKKKTGGMKIAAGIVIFPANKKVSAATKNYYFGSFFAQGCRPVVTTGIATASGGRYHAIVRGHGGLAPDHRGVRFTLLANAATVKKSKIYHKTYVFWQAVGY